MLLILVKLSSEVMKLIDYALQTFDTKGNVVFDSRGVVSNITLVGVVDILKPDGEVVINDLPYNKNLFYFVSRNMLSNGSLLVQFYPIYDEQKKVKGFFWNTDDATGFDTRNNYSPLRVFYGYY